MTETFLETSHPRLGRSSPRWQWLLPFLAGPLFIGAISVLAWFMLAGSITRGPGRIEYVIAAGTAQRIAAGEAVSALPAKAVFVVGDVLVLRNEDTVNHNLGPFWIPAGTTISIPLDRASTLNYLCTAHPSGYIGLEVRPQNSWLLTLVPTLLLGVPLGGVLALIIRVVSRLDAA
ncbi:MAG: hypothetical protein HY741_25115 [Chloroflexi bacterium]|nr:hypothetical protein [Chloroflexota bacterium]